MRELKELWSKVLGDPPAEMQFVVWSELHGHDLVRQSTLKTAAKNQALGGTMSLDHRLRSASKVLLTLTAQRLEHAENRQKLEVEFAGKEDLWKRRQTSNDAA